METNLDDLRGLIERAGKAIGSEYKLAKAMGIPQHHISSWKAGTRACVPADRARLAGFAQEDALKELVRSTIAANDGTTRGTQLRQLLGGSLRGIGAGLVAVLAALSLSYGKPLMAGEPARYDV